MRNDNKQSGVVVRPMKQEDIENMLAEDRSTTGEDRFITFATPLTRDQLVQEKTFGFVAETDDKMVGFLTGVLAKEPDGTDTAWIYITGVHPEYRHRNIGTGLAEAFFEYCRQQGLKSVHVNVNWGDALLLTWLGGLGFALSLGKPVEFERLL